MLGGVLLKSVLLCGEWRHLGRSSAELTLVPWWTEQLDLLDNSILPLFLMSPVINPLFRIRIFMS